MISRTCQLGMNSMGQRLRLSSEREDQETGSPGIRGLTAYLTNR